MKRILLAAVGVATLVAAGAASAQENQTVAINATVAPKCGVSAQSSTVTLPADLTNSEAKVRAAVTDEIAEALNGARIIAFCNGVNNSVTVERAVLAREGATDNGLTEGGFAQFIRYNLDASINGMLLDSTSDEGATTVAKRFGGHLSSSSEATHVRFAKATSDGAAIASRGGSSATAGNWLGLTDRRLAAGAYTGSINLIVAPGA
jgi:hypothetical protein